MPEVNFIKTEKGKTMTKKLVLVSNGVRGFRPLTIE